MQPPWPYYSRIEEETSTLTRRRGKLYLAELWRTTRFYRGSSASGFSPIGAVWVKYLEKQNKHDIWSVLLRIIWIQSSIHEHLFLLPPSWPSMEIFFHCVKKLRLASLASAASLLPCHECERVHVSIYWVFQGKPIYVCLQRGPFSGQGEGVMGSRLRLNH